MSFGMSDGFEPVHYLLEEAFIDGAYGKEISYTFLRGVENALHFDTNPIYAMLHEPCYCEGTACNWSAERMRAEFPEFAITPDRPVLFTGEMVYPWMFDEYRTLQPLKEAAHMLAQFDGWPQLYDKEVLRQNTVPVAAAMYYNDMYVDRLLSEEAASIIKGIHSVGHQRVRTQRPARRRRENSGALVRSGPRRNLDMQLYFIRHAQSANNKLYDETGSWNGRDSDPELPSWGIEQAQRLAEHVACANGESHRARLRESHATLV